MENSVGAWLRITAQEAPSVLRMSSDPNEVLLDLDVHQTITPRRMGYFRPLDTSFRIGISANKILQTDSRLPMMKRSSARDICACVEVDFVIEPPSPAAAPVLPDLA